MTNQKLLSELYAYAESGKQTKFRLLQNWQEYNTYKHIRRSTEAVVNLMQASAEKQLKDYCAAVRAGSANFYDLLALKSIIKILNCYTREYNTITDMVREYEAYIMEGNLLDAYFGEQRPAEHQFDFRYRSI